jgi:hypothetical protein
VNKTNKDPKIEHSMEIKEFNNLKQFFHLLFDIDKRNNPNKYKKHYD